MHWERETSTKWKYDCVDFDFKLLLKALCWSKDVDKKLCLQENFRSLFAKHNSTEQKKYRRVKKERYCLNGKSYSRKKNSKKKIVFNYTVTLE